MTNVKMTNAEARSLIEVLNELTNNKVSFSAKVWYALAKSKKGLVDNMKVVEEERVRLVNKYPKKNDKGELIGVAEDKMNEFQNEFMEVLSIEADVSLHKVDIKELEKNNGSIESVPNIYLLFQYLVKE